MTLRPQAVIFDIGNVLVGWRPEQFYDSVIGPEARRRLFAAVDLHSMNDGIDRGAREGERSQDREAPRAGAQIEDAARLGDGQDAARQHVADE